MQGGRCIRETLGVDFRGSGVGRDHGGMRAKGCTVSAASQRNGGHPPARSCCAARYSWDKESIAGFAGFSARDASGGIDAARQEEQGR